MRSVKVLSPHHKNYSTGHSTAARSFHDDLYELKHAKDAYNQTLH